MAAELLNATSRIKFKAREKIIDAIEFICQIATNLKYDLGEVRSEIADFRDRKGLWSFLWQGDSVSTVSPLIWWRSLRGTNLLADIVVKTLSATISSAGTERSFIHSTKRNRLTTLRAAKIAYLAHNWEL